MFRKTAAAQPAVTVPTERVTSVLGPGINWKGNLRGSGGVRIEGAFEGEITVRGLIVVGETGRVTCETLKANNVIVAGTVNGCITAEKLDIRSTGRVWGDVVVMALATEEGAFLRGQVRMEEKIEFEDSEAVEASASGLASAATAEAATGGDETTPRDRQAGHTSAPAQPERPVTE